MPQPDSPLTRRRALRLLAAAPLALPPALRAPGAAAARQWCRVDPVFRVAGVQDVHLWVAVRWTGKRGVRRLSPGPIEVQLIAPAGVPVKRLDDHPGFGEGFAVAIERDRARWPADGAVPLRLRVRVPFAKDAPAKAWLEVLGPGPVAAGGVRGRTNEWLEFATR